MNKPELSIIMPGIRPQHWMRAYKSIGESTNRTYELIIVSPFFPPAELHGFYNVKFIRDFGSPTRATQLGLILAEGRYILPCLSDDSMLIPSALDQNLDLLEAMGGNENDIITCKYSESKNFANSDRFQNDDYYKITNAYSLNKEIISDEWFVLNLPLMNRTYFEKLGGFNCSLGVTAISHADLSVRANIDKANIMLSDIPLLIVDHGQTDHKPIEMSQTMFDAPLLQAMYRKKTTKTVVNINNWKNTDIVWRFRYPKLSASIYQKQLVPNPPQNEFLNSSFNETGDNIPFGMEDNIYDTPYTPSFPFIPKETKLADQAPLIEFQTPK